MVDASVGPAAEDAANSAYIAAENARIAEMRRVAFAIEDALQKTPRGVNLERPTAIFVKRALFDYADTAELE